MVQFRNVVKFLVANKSESGRRSIDFEAGRRFAEENGEMIFLEVSAKFGTNINQTFKLLAEKLGEKYPQKMIPFHDDEEECEDEIGRLIPARDLRSRFEENVLPCCTLL